MTEATINGNASGVWAAEEGTRVVVEALAPNGRSALVKMPAEPAYLKSKAGRSCWLATCWLDIDKPVCPTCGRPLEEDSA